jgi:hypothetical protein
MTGIVLALIAVVVAASLFLDIFDFVFRTLPNFLRRAKIKKKPNPDYEVLAAMLKDMESAGLIKSKPGEDEEPAIKGKHQAEDHNTNKRAASLSSRRADTIRLARGDFTKAVLLLSRD